MAYYYCTLGVTAAAVWSLRAILGSPFGLTLRAIRDNPRRGMTLGLNVPLQQLVAFVLAGFFAGVAGVVMVFHKGSVFPEALSVVQSLDILVMVLLGGMQSFAGPLLGAGLYKLLDTVVTAHVEYWSAVLGVILGALVLLAPEGMLGYMAQCRERWRRGASSLWRQQGEQVLEDMGLAPQSGHLAGMLPYGDLKRLELAIALAHDPAVALLDEPTAGLAPPEREALVRLIQSIVLRRGVAVLFTEHDMDVVFGLAQSVLVLYQGQVIAAGTPPEVRADAEVQRLYLGGRR